METKDSENGRRPTDVAMATYVAGGGKKKTKRFGGDKKQCCSYKPKGALSSTYYSYSGASPVDAYQIDNESLLDHGADVNAEMAVYGDVTEPADDAVEVHCTYLERCLTIKCFAFFCCVFAVVSGALVTGYVSSVITTIEKRFEIGSSASGFIVASVEFGTLGAAIFISYFGGRRRIPAWIGFGACVQGIGAMVFVLPHLLAQTYTITGGLGGNSTLGDNVCTLGPQRAKKMYPGQICDLRGGFGNGPYVMILVLAQTMVGIGGSPLFTLGTTYIDDHVTRESAPIFIAFLYATGALGPVLGFGLGALMLQFYVDTFTFDNRILNLTPADSDWVGAWWGGFIICGVLLLLTSIPFFGFPKVLVREKQKLREKAAGLVDSKVVEDDPLGRTGPRNYGTSIKELPRSLWRLLSNPIYLITSLGICCEISIVSGFILFLPKYLETQFGLSKSFANLLTGGIGIPGAVVGILVGGYLLKRFQLGAKGAVQLTLILNLSASTGFGLLLFLGCDNVKMAGATTPYFNSSVQQLSRPDLAAPCNVHCGCSANEMEVVCGVNGLTYFSPCHAGCVSVHAVDGSRRQNYTNCACIRADLGVQQAELTSQAPMATNGRCRSTCDSLLPFMLLLFLMTFLVAGTQMPLLMTTLRSVQMEERAFALGVQFVLLRVFAYIPAPILFGTIIDTTCILWEKVCGGHGACLLYDVVLFRYKYVGNCAGMKLVGALFFGVVWLFIKRDELRRSRAKHKEDSTADHTEASCSWTGLEPVYDDNRPHENDVTTRDRKQDDRPVIYESSL